MLSALKSSRFVRIDPQFSHVIGFMIFFSESGIEGSDFSKPEKSIDATRGNWFNSSSLSFLFYNLLNEFLIKKTIL